jgi:hypothetical protein
LERENKQQLSAREYQKEIYSPKEGAKMDVPQAWHLLTERANGAIASLTNDVLALLLFMNALLQWPQQTRRDHMMVISDRLWEVG